MERWFKVARENIEAHLGNVCESEDSSYEEAYILAADALVDAGCPEDLVGSVAHQVVQDYA